MFEKLLEYQKLDGKLLSLKRELEKDATRQTLNKVVSLVKDSQSKLLELDAKAKACIADYEKYKKDYERVFNELSEISNKDVSSLTEEELSANVEKANQLIALIGTLERGLSAQAESINGILKSFDVCRNNIVTYKQKYKESKLVCEQHEASLKPQFEEIKKQMATMEKDIEPKMLAKYKHLRQDKIFPVLVPLNNNACGGCSMEVPAALMNKLKSTGYLECEQCRRCIILNK